MQPTRNFKILTVAVGLALVAACGSDSDSDTTTDDKVELTFWSWAPNIDKVVDLWNADHPNTHVAVSKQAQGDELVVKLLTAAKAGNPPDLFQAEYQALPTLVSNDVTADIAEYVGDTKEGFAEGLWQQVTFGGDAVYAVPQDSGPMMLYYRSDLFAEMGLAVPTTWAEFAETAKQVRAKDPGRYLTTFSAADPGWFAGLAQQAGASWWSISGDSWKVSINDTATKQVAQYWGDLVADGAVDNKPMYTPEWNKALNDGTLLAWPSAIWAPGVLEGNAADTKGKWSMAELPQWNAGEHKTGNWGGSSTAVAAKSKHQQRATEFAIWLNTDPAATEALVKEGGLYPAARDAQSGPALTEPPAFFAEQTDFYPKAKEIADTAAGFTWGPNVNVTYSTYKDAFTAAITSSTPFGPAVDTMQEATIADMRKSGFTITD
ncbi:MAG: extracellular solute-binding protein [Dactylosporangium sp.]|nr:extracellular solute-binding protein [Dactylosporangium sp.]NNJ59862.1 extracellular solute-binding protein [Dactylosporangium sp.]